MPLQYKTRGQSSPQGKPRVYFCCHPADLGRYVERIADDILKLQNCALWYESDDSFALNDSRRDELKDMQLFVMPVTWRLLLKENRGLEEFRFAVEQKIPVLPLMQDPDLVEKFNEVCGDLQFLDPYDRDPTSIPYGEKLEKFLSSVLVGDQLAQQVRDAFDAYVFLSYRKKDRKQAQELMRLIHQNDFCQDVAIWYDEFLVPGEDFNRAIGKAMAKSRLFALNVTPSLLEDPNYIKTHEYPAAAKSELTVLPVETVSTDRNALEELYEDIPACVDAQDGAALSQALLDGLKGIALREKKDDPRHTYFIGLAYLNGIDVEVDRERGVKLVTQAAEGGLPEAVEKLVGMYRSGGSVERNYRTAITWQEKLVELRRVQAMRSNKEEDAFLWLDAQLELSSNLEELEELDAAEQVCRQILDIVEKNKNMDIRKTCHWVSLGRLGHIADIRDNWEQAKDYYMQSLNLLWELYEQTEESEYMNPISICYRCLGAIAQAEDNLGQAREYCLQSLNLSRELYEQSGILEDKRILSAIYNDLGTIAQREGNWEEAKAYHTQSLNLFRELYEQTGMIADAQNLSINYSNLGSVAWSEGNWERAKDYYTQSLNLRRELYEQTGMILDKRHLADIYINLGNAAWAEDHWEQAKEHYIQVINLSRELHEQTKTVESKRNLSFGYNRLGDIAYNEDNREQAKEYYTQSLDLDRELYEQTETVDSKRNLASNYQRLGDVARDEENLEKAMDCYIQSLKLFQEIYKQMREIESKRDLAICHSRLGDAASIERNWKTAKGQYRQSLKLFQEIYKHTGTIESKQDLAACYSRLGDVAFGEENWNTAKERYTQSLKLLREIYKHAETVESKQCLAICYRRLGNVARAVGNWKVAEDYYIQDIKLRRELHK